MKKNFKIITIIAIAVLTLGMTGQVFAQTPEPTFPAGSERGNGKGGANSAGTGVPLDMNINLDGGIEELLHGYLADAIEIDPLALVDGNFHEIALELGYDVTEINEIVAQAHSDALAQALVDGLVTQEEYDWLSRDRGSMGASKGAGTGVCTEDCTVDGGPLFDGTRQNKGYRGGK